MFAGKRERLVVLKKGASFFHELPHGGSRDEFIDKYDTEHQDKFRDRAAWHVDVDSYSWDRTLGNGTVVRQTAASIASGPRAFINSFDRSLFNDGLTPSKAIIDFSTNPAVTVVNIYKTCYLVDTDPSLNFTNTVTEMLSRNGNAVTTALNNVFLNVSRLDRAARTAVFNSNPSMKKLCNPYFTPIYQTIAAAETTPGDCQKVVSTVTLYDELNILIPVRHGYGCSTHSSHGHHGHHGHRGFGGFRGHRFGSFYG
ncbi:uncharacterized protein LOC143288723 [Babylonia areolata]|uniref:uncharacterized protein LOC143288723 n=1 Tax=Babylonia areolata TaxID=304850 RepID=UPI003FD4E23E